MLVEKHGREAGLDILILKLHHLPEHPIDASVTIGVFSMVIRVTKMQVEFFHLLTILRKKGRSILRIHELFMQLSWKSFYSSITCSHQCVCPKVFLSSCHSVAVLFLVWPSAHFNVTILNR